MLMPTTPQRSKRCVEHVVGEFGLVAAVEGADAEMRHADAQGAAVVAGPPHGLGSRGSSAGPSVSVVRRGAHPLAPTTHCSWSTSAPVIGPEASERRKTARLATSSTATRRPKGSGGLRPRRSSPSPRAERLRLHQLLAVGGDPAHVDAVDLDAVALVGVGGVPGERRQRALGRRVDGELGRAAVGVHRQDVDDRPAFAPLAHGADRSLHQEEGGAGVDVEEPGPDAGIGVEEGGAVGQAGGIDEEVDAAEAGEARRDQPGGSVRVGQLGGDELRRRA